MALYVKSPAFKDQEMIPNKYGEHYENVSPPLSWSAAPDGTKSIALISDDPDAPMKIWVHWLIFNIPGSLAGLPEGVGRDGTLADGSMQGLNDSGGIGYDGPAPPSGVHRYYFRVYALDTSLSLKPGCSRRELDSAMKGHILAQGLLMGRFKS